MTTTAAKLARLEPLELEPAGASLAEPQQTQLHHQHFHHHHHQPPVQEAAARHMSQLVALASSPAPDLSQQQQQQQFAAKSAHQQQQPADQHLHLHQHPQLPLQQLPQHTRALSNAAPTPATCQQHQPAPAQTNTAPVAKKRGRRRQQSQPEQANGLDHVFLWDIDGSLVRSGTIVDSAEGPLEPSVLASVNDKLGQLAKRLKELALNFCDEHLYLSELETVDQMHIDDVPSAEPAQQQQHASTAAAATTTTSNSTGAAHNGHQPSAPQLTPAGPNQLATTEAGQQEPPPQTHDTKPQAMQHFASANNNKLVLVPLIQQPQADNNNNDELYGSAAHLAAEQLEQRYEPFEPIYEQHEQQQQQQVSRPHGDQLDYAAQEQLYSDSTQQQSLHHHHHQHQQHHHSQTHNHSHLHLHQNHHHHHHHHQLQLQQQQQQHAASEPPAANPAELHSHAHHYHHNQHHSSGGQQAAGSQMHQQSPPSSLHGCLQQRHFQHQQSPPLQQPHFQAHYDNFSTPQTFQPVGSVEPASAAAAAAATGGSYYQSAATPADCERAYLLEPSPADSHYYSHHPYHHHHHQHQHHHHHHQLSNHLSHHQHQPHHTQHSQEQLNSSSLVSGQYMSHESSGTSESGYATSLSTAAGVYQQADEQSFSQLAILHGNQAYTPAPGSDSAADQLWLANHDTSAQSTHGSGNFQADQALHSHPHQVTYSSASLADSSEHQFHLTQFHQPHHHPHHHHHQTNHHHNHSNQQQHHQHQLHLQQQQPQQELLHVPAQEALPQQPLLNPGCQQIPLRVDTDHKPLIEAPATCQLEPADQLSTTTPAHHPNQHQHQQLPHHHHHHHHNQHHQHQHQQPHHLLHLQNQQQQPQSQRPANDSEQQASALRTVLSNQHKQMTHKLSMRFHRIKAVYNLNRNTGPAGGLFKGNEQMANDLAEILTEIDHYTLDWRKRAMDCLRLIAESPNCTNIIITKLPLIVALGHLVCLDLAQFFDIDQVYSASKTSKETCIARIKKRFGATNRCSYIIVGPKDKENVDVSERLDLPVWPTTRSDGHRQLTNLMRALREGLLM